MQHLFNNCEHIQSKEFQVKIVRDFQNILLGNVIENPNHPANFICIVIKYQIYMCRCKKRKPTSFQMQRYIEQCKRYEMYNAKANEKLDIH